ncbi:hypothetical protein PRIPAC_76880 [Pristionchus pacificus]|uniref:Uncharacterized protein n=1 Tax=Pristionchus pacificus TaxID=54126 RepID=A0A2A6BW41_PRIPA|nr:hypothetical protein PRIPAC_76880 [Pristionchus pacificus]|eukprot:PDM70046.1 hypothetical protein PRIPAC_49258 [Pristionchus pacificus]
MNSSDIPPGLRLFRRVHNRTQLGPSDWVVEPRIPRMNAPSNLLYFVTLQRIKLELLVLQ